MKARSTAVVNVAVVWALLLQVPFLIAADAKPTPQAPLPSQILEAKKIFIANGGADEMIEGQPGFSGGPDRAYNQFFAAMKNWARYQIVSSPADADLLLEIEVAVPGGDPLFRLRIRDPKTNATLWGFNVYTQFGLGQGNSDRNFDQAVNHLVAETQALVARAPVPSTSTAGP